MNLLNAGKGLISEKLAIVLMCKRMNWRYEDYLRQPTWFIQAIEITDAVEARYQKILARRNKNAR